MRRALRTLWACSRGFSAYPALSTAPQREVAGYLLTIVLLTAVLLAIPVCREFRRQMATLITWAQQLPTITIVEGTAGIVEPPPARFERYDVAGVGDLILVVDPTGQTRTVPVARGMSFLITDHELIIQRGTASRHYSFQKIRRLIIDDAFIAQWGRRLTSWLCWLAPLLLIAYGLVARLLQALLWSGIAWLMLRWSQPRLSFGSLWRLAVFALGPPLVFATIVELLTGTRGQPLVWLLYLLVYAVFSNGAIATTRRPKLS